MFSEPAEFPRRSGGTSPAPSLPSSGLAVRRCWRCGGRGGGAGIGRTEKKPASSTRDTAPDPLCGCSRKWRERGSPSPPLSTNHDDSRAKIRSRPQEGAGGRQEEGEGGRPPPQGRSADGPATPLPRLPDPFTPRPGRSTGLQRRPRMLPGGRALKARLEAEAEVEAEVDSEAEAEAASLPGTPSPAEATPPPGQAESPIRGSIPDAAANARPAAAAAAEEERDRAGAAEPAGSPRTKSRTASCWPSSSRSTTSVGLSPRGSARCSTPRGTDADEAPAPGSQVA